jgi:hypothetical protein
VAATIAPSASARAAAQSSREANPERPTFATHAYAVAAGYAELEQGLSARGSHSLREGTSWDVNLKLGITRHVQVALFGPLYARRGSGGGVGDLGVALKLRTDPSPRVALAVVSTVTGPTAARSLGAGRVLGGLVGVLSADVLGAIHVDVNAGPQGIGAGAPQWFTSLSAARAFRSVGVTVELFDFTHGGAGPRLAGVLGAVTVRLAPWTVADVGGVAGTARETPNQLFIGMTTNLVRVF